MDINNYEKFLTINPFIAFIVTIFYFLFYFVYFYYSFKYINSALEVELSKRRQIFNLFLFHIIATFLLFLTVILLKSLNAIDNIMVLLTFIIIPLSYYIIIRKESSDNFLTSMFVILVYYSIFSFVYYILLYFLSLIIFQLLLI